MGKSEAIQWISRLQNALAIEMQQSVPMAEPKATQYRKLLAILVDSEKQIRSTPESEIDRTIGRLIEALRKEGE